MYEDRNKTVSLVICEDVVRWFVGVGRRVGVSFSFSCGVVFS